MSVAIAAINFHVCCWWACSGCSSLPSPPPPPLSSLVPAQELLTLCIAPSGPALAAVLSGDAARAKAAHHSAKRQYAAAEVLTASVPRLLDALVCGRPPPLERLWDALRHTPPGGLDNLAAGRITRVLAAVLASRGEELLRHLCAANGRSVSSKAAAPGGALSALVRHVSLPVVADLFVRLLDTPDQQEGEPDPAGGSGLVRSSDEEPSASAHAEAPRAAALQLLADCDVVVVLITSAVSQFSSSSSAGGGADQLLREETVTATLTTVVAITRRLLYLHTVGVEVPPAIFVYANGPAADAIGGALDAALSAEANGQPLPLRRMLVAMRELMDAAMPPPSGDGNSPESGLGGAAGAGGVGVSGARGAGGGGVMGGRARPLPRFAAAGRQGYGNRFRAPARGRPGGGVGRPAGGGGAGITWQTQQPVSPASAMAAADADAVPEVVDQVVEDIDDDAVANACTNTTAAAENAEAKAGAPAVDATPPAPVEPVVSLAALEGVLMARLPALLCLLTRRLNRARTTTIPVPMGSIGLALSPPTLSADSALGLTGLCVAELLATVLARGSADGVGTLSQQGVPATLLAAITAYPWTSMLHAAVSRCIKTALAVDAHPYRVRAWREAGLLRWLNEAWTAGNVADGCATGSRDEPPRAEGGGDDATADGNSAPQRRSSSDLSSPAAVAAAPPNNSASEASREARELRRQREGGAGGVSRLRPAYMGHLVSIAVDVGAWLDRLQPPSVSGSGATSAEAAPSEPDVAAIRALLGGSVGEAVTAQERPLGERHGAMDGGAAGGPLDGRQEDDDDAVEEVVEVIFDYQSGEGDDASDVSDAMDVQAEADGAVARGRSSSKSGAAGDARKRSLSAALAEALPDKSDRKKPAGSGDNVASRRSGGRGSGRRADPSVASQSAAVTELEEGDEEPVEDNDPPEGEAVKTPSPPPALPSTPSPPPATVPHVNGKVAAASRAAGTASDLASATAAVAAMDLSSSDDEDEYVKFDPDADDFPEWPVDGGCAASAVGAAVASTTGGAKTPAAPILAVPAGAPSSPPTRVSNFVAADGDSSSDEDGDWEPFDPDDDDDDEEEGGDGSGEGVGQDSGAASPASTGGSSDMAAPPPSTASRGGVLPASFSAVATAATGGKARR